MPVGHYDRTRIPRRGRPGFLRAIMGDLDRSWMSLAVCRLLPLAEVDEIFFPINGRSHRAKRRYAAKVGRAKAICASCPVIQQCEGYRHAMSDPNGVWGGLDEIDRDPEKKQIELEPEPDDTPTTEGTQHTCASHPRKPKTSRSTPARSVTR